MTGAALHNGTFAQRSAAIPVASHAEADNSENSDKLRTQNWIRRASASWIPGIFVRLTAGLSTSRHLDWRS